MFLLVTRLALAVFLTRPVSYRSPHTRAQCTGSLPHAIHRARHNAEHARLDQRPDAVISNEISLELPDKCSTQRRADLDGRLRGMAGSGRGPPIRIAPSYTPSFTSSTHLLTNKHPLFFDRHRRIATCKPSYGVHACLRFCAPPGFHSGRACCNMDPVDTGNRRAI